MTSISSSFVPAIQLSSTEPLISADQAVALAHQHLVNGTRVAAPRLVVSSARNAPGSSAKLAWIVELRDDAIPARILYVVDALEGS